MPQRTCEATNERRVMRARAHADVIDDRRVKKRAHKCRRQNAQPPAVRTQTSRRSARARVRQGASTRRRRRRRRHTTTTATNHEARRHAPRCAKSWRHPQRVWSKTRRRKLEARGLEASRVELSQLVCSPCAARRLRLCHRDANEKLLDSSLARQRRAFARVCARRHR